MVRTAFCRCHMAKKIRKKIPTLIAVCFLLSSNSTLVPLGNEGEGKIFVLEVHAFKVHCYLIDQITMEGEQNNQENLVAPQIELVLAGQRDGEREPAIFYEVAGVDVVHWISMCLEDVPIEWFMSLVPQPQTYNELKAALLTAFYDRNYEYDLESKLRKSFPNPDSRNKLKLFSHLANNSDWSSKIHPPTPCMYVTQEKLQKAITGVERKVKQVENKMDVKFKNVQSKIDGCTTSVIQATSDRFKNDAKENTRRENSFNNQSPFKRTHEGKPICNRCNLPGHIARNCLLLIRDPDTVVSSTSSKLLNVPLQRWIGPDILLADGQRTRPLGRRGDIDNVTVFVSAIVFQINGYDLLLGNNTLCQHKFIKINNEEEQVSFILGNIDCTDNHQKSTLNYVFSKDAHTIPAYSLVAITVQRTKDIERSVQDRIDIVHHKPVHQVPYPSAWKQHDHIEPQVKRIEDTGIIKRPQSLFAAPDVLVRKPDGTRRFCIHCHRLNAITIKDIYPIPRIEDTLRRL
ncbi:Uncharacterized protein APZ42_028897 [Daphnia magna]|uniref:CCHC-type domain-containing protein n=1 Tax=Daphnia magna TaxID=35525 RepID=A0A162D5U8_9CRUS|nr:Uncharacterized protein APZ42_028897 [Daphnia magna]